MRDAASVDLERQITHWGTAARRLADLDDHAPPEAWNSLDAYLRSAVQRPLGAAATAVAGLAEDLRTELARGADPLVLGTRLRQLRREYLRTELLVDVYADAVVTRAASSTGSLLRACDVLCRHGMRIALEPLGVPVPPTLVYVDRGIGAAILKAGLRLWDGRTANPAALIKLARHNMLLPTALLHEVGHQVAHLLHLNTEVAALLEATLPSSVASTWSSWASEIVADVYAFALVGYGAVSALHDTVADVPALAFVSMPGDPHPNAYLRVLLGVELCRAAWGAGPWDTLAALWRDRHPLGLATEASRQLVAASLPELPRVATALLRHRLAGLGGRSMADLWPIAELTPRALDRFAADAGAGLFSSPELILASPLRILAFVSWRLASEPKRADLWLRAQRTWMNVLGARAATC